MVLSAEKLLLHMKNLILGNELRVVLMENISVNGFYSEKNNQKLIVLNANNSQEKQVETLIHEFAHAFYNHLPDETKTIEMKESEAEYLVTHFKKERIEVMEWLKNIS